MDQAAAIRSLDAKERTPNRCALAESEGFPLCSRLRFSHTTFRATVLLRFAIPNLHKKKYAP